MISRILAASIPILAMIAPTAVDAQNVPGTDTTYATQESRGQVTLELTPRWVNGALAVAVRANTHSVDLSTMDLASQMRLLVADSLILPDEAGTLGGHHASAEVVFALQERPPAFTLEITGIPDIPRRTLQWPRPAPTGTH